MFTKRYSADQIGDDEMDETRGTYGGRGEVHKGIW